MLDILIQMWELATSSPYFATNVLPYWVGFAVALVAARRWLRW